MFTLFIFIFKAAVVVVACAYTIHHIKSENFEKILFECGKNDSKHQERIAKFWDFPDIPENRLKCSDTCILSILESKQSVS